MTQPAAESFEDLVSTAKARSRRMAFFLVSLGLTAALIGIATGIWSTDAARRKAIAAQHLTQVQQQLTESITAQQDARAF